MKPSDLEAWLAGAPDPIGNIEMTVPVPLTLPVQWWITLGLLAKHNNRDLGWAVGQLLVRAEDQGDNAVSTAICEIQGCDFIALQEKAGPN